MRRLGGLAMVLRIFCIELRDWARNDRRELSSEVVRLNFSGLDWETEKASSRSSKSCSMASRLECNSSAVHTSSWFEGEETVC